MNVDLFLLETIFGLLLLVGHVALFDSFGSSSNVTVAATMAQVTLHPDARNTAWVSFDGRHHQEMNVGDRFVPCPFPFQPDTLL